MDSTKFYTPQELIEEVSRFHKGLGRRISHMKNFDSNGNVIGYSIDTDLSFSAAQRLINRFGGKLNVVKYFNVPYTGMQSIRETRFLRNRYLNPYIGEKILTRICKEFKSDIFEVMTSKLLHDRQDDTLVLEVGLRFKHTAS